MAIIGGMEIFDNGKFTRIKNIILEQIRPSKEDYVLCMVTTAYGGLPPHWCLVALKDKIVFIEANVGVNYKTFYYRDITGIDFTKSWLAGDITIKTASDSINIPLRGNEDLKPFRDGLNKLMEKSKTPANSNGVSQSMASDLERLVSLHRGGGLTDDEFIKAKKKLIGY